MHLEWVLTNQMFVLLFMQIFQIVWKIITRKLVVRVVMVKNPMLYCFMMIMISLNWRDWPPFVIRPWMISGMFTSQSLIIYKYQQAVAKEIIMILILLILPRSLN